MQIKQETISPKRAAEMLGNARANRNVRLRKVAYYAGVIERGEWEPNNPSPIGLDTKGRLAEGQHRLLGVVEAGKPIKAWVAYDMPDSVIDTIDTGASRTMGDVLRLRGEQMVIPLAATLRQVWQYRNFEILGGKISDPSHNELLKLLEAEPNIRNSVTYMFDKSKTLLGVGPSIWAAAYHLFAEKNEEDAEDFIEKLTTGENLKATEPVYMLRKAVMEYRFKRPQRVSAALIVKAWNAYRNNETIEALSYKAGGRSPEPFPVIE